MMEQKQVEGLRAFRQGIKLVKPLTLATSGVLTLDLALGTVGVFNVAVNSGVNITGIEIINPPATAALPGETLSSEISFMLYVTRTAMLGTFAWGASETWRPSNISYTLSATAGRTDSFIFQSLDGASSWFVYQGAVGYA